MIYYYYGRNDKNEELCFSLWTLYLQISVMHKTFLPIYLIFNVLCTIIQVVPNHNNAVFTSMKFVA